MQQIISLAYLLLIFVFLAMGGAIIFHLLFYRINRHVASIMSIIYIIGSIALLISNFTMFRAVDWYHLAFSTGL
jgi:hypothetical protein